MDAIKAQTESVLSQFNQQFETSKRELIGRFLQDQDELNKRFSEYALNDSEDDRDSTTTTTSGRKGKVGSGNKDKKKRGHTPLLKLQNFDSDEESNSSLDSIVTNPDNSDNSDKEEIYVPPQKPYVRPQQQSAPKQFLANSSPYHDSRSVLLRKTYGQEPVSAKHNAYEKSSTSQPWLARTRGNPRRRLPQPPVTDEKPKPWSLRPRQNATEHQEKDPRASRTAGYVTGRAAANTDAHCNDAHHHDTYHHHQVDEAEMNAQNQRQSQLQSRSLGRSKSLRCPDRSGAYTPTQGINEPSLPQAEREADSGFEERSRGGSMRLANEKPKKLLKKRSVRPMTAMGLRNHERVVEDGASHGRFIDTDQTRSAPAAATRKKQLVSNAGEYVLAPEPPRGELSRSNSIRSDIGSARRSTHSDMKPPQGHQSRRVSRHGASTEEEETYALIHRTKSSEVLNTGLKTPETSRKYSKLHSESSLGYSAHAPHKSESSLKKARSCGNFPLAPIPTGSKVAVLKLPNISRNSNSERKSQREKAGTSLGYYVTSEAMV